VSAAANILLITGFIYVIQKRKIEFFVFEKIFIALLSIICSGLYSIIILKKGSYGMSLINSYILQNDFHNNCRGLYSIKHLIMNIFLCNPSCAVNLFCELIFELFDKNINNFIIINNAVTLPYLLTASAMFLKSLKINGIKFIFILILFSVPIITETTPAMFGMIFVFLIMLLKKNGFVNIIIIISMTFAAALIDSRYTYWSLGYFAAEIIFADKENKKFVKNLFVNTSVIFICVAAVWIFRKIWAYYSGAYISFDKYEKTSYIVYAFLIFGVISEVLQKYIKAYTT